MRRTGPTSTRRRLPAPPLLALLVVVASACATAGAGPAPDPGAPAAASDARVAAEVRTMMEASAEAWNRGDLDGFLADYADDASFVTSAGLVHGRAAIREIYARGYWRDGQGPRDALRFADFDIRATGPAAAIAFGRFILSDRESGDAKATGTFSLTLRRSGDGWKIVHDHSSADG